jgi:ABC-2 type transport system permease protein
MSSLSLAVTDSVTMLRRNLLRMRRYPSMTVLLIAMPVVFLLLFVYVFGGTLGAGLAAGGGRAEYLDYVTPAIMLMAAAAAAQGTAISVAMDKTAGIFARFRTMAIARASVLTGHVLGSVVQSALAMTTLLVVAVVLGFRPSASTLDWLALLGFVTLVAFALTWLTVAMGLSAATVEVASNSPMFLVILPFLSSGFVPVESMPTWLGWVAEHQPFTPMIETTRGLLAGEPDLSTALLAVGWCAAIALAGYVWARALDRRDPSS